MKKFYTPLLKFAFYFFLCVLYPNFAVAQSDTSARMQWFSEAKLGIFIHWGIYSVNGTGESWAFHNRNVPYDQYMSQIDGFTASHYDARAWASLISESGAQYAVITSKHHDGVALWNTRMNNLSIPHKSPARRDVLQPFAIALRNEGLKLGIYYSLIDWSYPDYPGFLKDSSRYQIKDNPKRWNRFLKFYHGQIDELLQQYNPDLWWFDGDWEHSAAEWNAKEIRTKILKYNPMSIINGRLQGMGDYETPEQNFPVSRPTAPIWELCMTINDSWGWQPNDTNFKTPYQVISIFADVISNGGNLLLDIGPKEDGTIPEPQVKVLKELGKWTKKHHEAIFGTLGGMPNGHFYGSSTLAKDSLTLFLFLPSNPTGQVVIKGLFTEIETVEMMGWSTPLKFNIVGKISWSPVPGLVYITLPTSQLDPYMSVLKVKLKSPLRLYKGKGGLSL